MKKASFIVIISMLMALVSLVINMMLPAYIKIKQSFNLSDSSEVHKVVSFLYLGLAIGQLFLGPLSDAWGRKKVMALGLLTFLFGCLISTLATKFNFLLIGQIIQGLGLGAPRVLSLSIVRDKFSGNGMAKIMSYIMVVYILTPTVSPTFGKFIVDLVPWKYLFVLFGFITIIVLVLYGLNLPETLPIDRRGKFRVSKILHSIKEISSNRATTLYIVILGLYSGVFIGILNLSQQIFEFDYNLGDRYPFYFAFLALSIGAASFLNGTIVTYFGTKRLIEKAIQLSFLCALGFLISLFINNGVMSFANLFSFLVCQFFCYGILIGNISAQAMKPFGHIAGLASAIIGSISTILSVPLSILVGKLYNSSQMIVVLSFFAIGFLSILILKSQIITIHEK